MKRSDIISIFGLNISYLKSKASLFLELEDNPKLILTKLFNQDLGSPHYDMHMNVFKNNETNYHDVQEYLFNIIKPYLESMDSDITVEIRNRNSYPSRFYIQYKNEQIVGFDIYHQWYGKFRDNKDISRMYKNIDAIKKSIEENKEEKRKYENFLENPFKACSSFREKVWLAFWLRKKENRETIRSNIKQEIERYEKYIVDDNKNIKNIEDKIKYIEEHGKDIENKKEEWLQFFDELGYQRLENGSASLY